MIELKNVKCIYEEKTPDAFTALKGVSLTVQDGEIWGIIGHTGSGKSTLVEIMSGLLKPTEGRVIIDGVDITGIKKPFGAIKGKVGMVFQYPEHQLFEESVIKDICFGPKNMGLSEQESVERAREAMALVGLSPEFENLSPFELSGGEKRRVAIAGIIAMRPKTLILDEPTAGLDPVGRDSLLHMLKNIKGTLCESIVLVSHSMEDVAAFAEKVLVMHKGAAVLAGDVETVFEKNELLLEYGLDVPQITRLMGRLKKCGHDFNLGIITVEDAAEAIYKKLKG